MTRDYFGPDTNFVPFPIYIDIPANNFEATCPKPQNCPQFGCGEYYCTWVWDATGEIEGGMAAWIGQGDGSPCPEGCECAYPSSSGTYDRETTITYCASSSPTTTLSP